MTATLIQTALAVFGLAAVYMALSEGRTARKWAPIVGLAGQPFWFAFAWTTNSWGLLPTVVGFSAVYVIGAIRQWAPPLPLSELAPHQLPDTEAQRAELAEHARRQEVALLAAELADIHAVADVTANCPTETFGGRTRFIWYDTHRAGAEPGEPEGDPDVVESVEASARYLALRGVLVHHPQQPALVRLTPGLPATDAELEAA